MRTGAACPSRLRLVLAGVLARYPQGAGHCDAAIHRVKGTFEEPLRSMVEIRNQARVHLWFEGKFGEPYGPLSCSAEALERFTSATFAVGVRLEPDNRLHIEAPFGLADLFGLRLRPNPRWKTVHFARTSAGVRRRWPELVIDNGHHRGVQPVR